MGGTEQVPSDLLREAVNQADYGIYLADRDGNITFANTSMERISGRSRIELTGSSTRIFRSGETSD